eukprot:TRINITY_DN6482_c0_g1_i1.p1 TRINITY_DN6482_c0_g1~~TRINITY_DN6482_c0_g1_i1.p1  ORF type:complete len:429 (+),score=97.52 TRINITY_DN6482_c0_g1_i1:307-1593(+)
MGSTEAGTPSKSEKASSPVQEPFNVHAYPDWTAIQAYYRPGVSLPPPFFSSAVTSGHAPHPYMWGPQPLMPPYGTPYAAIYSHGGVYTHPSVPLGSHSHGHGSASSVTTGEPVLATPLSIETPVKSPSNKDRGLVKKLKGSDGLAVSVGNGNADNISGGTMHGLSSEECTPEGSSDGSDGNTTQRGNQTKRKSSEDTSATGKDGKVDTLAKSIHGGKSNASSCKPFMADVGPVSVAGKPVGVVPSPSRTPGMEFTVSTVGKPKSSAAMSACDGFPSEHWIQDDKELKRERRKQSNRESARRSRLRKQAESDELATRVDSLNAENIALRSELSRLTENSEKLRRENSALAEKLKNAKLVKTGEMSLDNNIKTHKAPPGFTEHFLSRLNNNPSSVGTSEQQGRDTNEKASSKPHQLFEESNARTDAVAAG